MAYDTGYSSFFKVSDEVTFGTAVAPTDDLLILDATGNIKETQNITEEYKTGSRVTQCVKYGNYAVDGSLTGKLQGGRLISYALGTEAGTVATGLYTHTITQADTTSLPSFTLDKAHIKTDTAQRAAGCKINDFSLNLDVDGMLTSTFNWLGASVTNIETTVGTRGASTTCPFSAYQGVIAWNSNTIECSAFDFNYSNNLSGDEYNLGDRRRQTITEGAANVNGTFTLLFEDFTVYDDFQSTWSAGTETGTSRALTFTANNGASGTDERELAITMADTTLSEVDSPVELSEGRMVQTFSYIPKTLTNIVFKDDVAVEYIDGSAIV